MKEKLREGGRECAAFARIASLEDLKAFIAKAGFPIVIKPVDNSGARGVQRLTAGMDIGAAFDYSRGFAYGGEVIAEKFIPGLQISTEGLFHDGRFYCTGFADRNYTRLDDAVPFMVEDGGDIPTVLNQAQKKLVEAEFEKAARALGIDWGPAKGDMIFGDDGKPYVIEIAARLSGGNFCYDKVPWSTGVDIVDILVDMAVGNAGRSGALYAHAQSCHLAALFLSRSRHHPPDRGLSRRRRACRISARWMSGRGPAKPSRRRKTIPRGSAMSFPAPPRARKRWRPRKPPWPASGFQVEA